MVLKSSCTFVLASARLSWLAAIALMALHLQAAPSQTSPVVYDGPDLACGRGRQTELTQATTLCMCYPSSLVGQQNPTLPPSLGTNVVFTGSLLWVVGTLFSWLLGCSLSHIFKARLLLVLIPFEGLFPFRTVSNLRPGMDLFIICVLALSTQ